MKRFNLVLTLAIFALGSAISSGAEETKAALDATSKWMVEQERVWAEEECAHKSILADLLAEDFRGTSPKGERYSKAQAIARAASSTSHATDCRLLEADVRFFGPDTAIIYGSETALEAPPGGTAERYCLIWTDTWLKRGGKWQIAAAQDATTKCPAM